jgi:hypothetical protein
MIKHNVCLAISFLLMLSVLCKAQSDPPVKDFQIWTETSVSVPLIKEKTPDGKSVERLSIFFFGTLRLGQNRAYPVDKRLGVGFDIRLNDHFTFSPIYLYRAGEPGRDRKEYEHRIRFDLTFDHKWKRFSIKNRDRIEYRIRHSRADSVRFRNKFTFKVPVTKNEKELFAPFVADEPFYDFHEKAWTRNEFSAGISKKINKNLTADFFYILQNNRGSTLKYVNGVGVNLKFKLD